MIYSLLSSNISEGLKNNTQDERLLEMIRREISNEEVRKAVAACESGWAIDKNLAHIIAVAIIEGGKRNILEFGAGTSSLICALALKSVNGGKLTSIEQNPIWCADKWDIIKEIKNVDSRLIKSKPQKSWGKLGLVHEFSDAKEAISERDKYDLVIVDAPQKFLGREGAIPLIYELLKPGALIIIDDAQRVGEKWAIWQWLKAYPGLKMRYLENNTGEKGVAILEYVDHVVPKFSLKVFLAGIMNHQFRRKVYKKDVDSADILQ
jgi:predicted O-methyltransferase YrrM